MAAKKASKGDEESEDGDKKRLGALNKAVADIRKSLGKSALIKASSRISGYVGRIPTGIFLLDYAMGGGVARGRVNIFWGKQSSGKTSNSCRVIAHAQNMCASCNTYLGPEIVKTKKNADGEFYAEAECKTCNNYREFICAYADIEGSFDGPWAKKLGVDLDRLWFSQPETAEQSIDVVDTLLRTGDLDLIVVDSIAQMVPSAEVEESVAKWQQGLQARLVNKAFRKWTGALNYVGNTFGHKPTIIAINQIRFKIGVMFGCFSYLAPVMLANGTSRSIGEIVNGKQDIEVMSLNITTGKFESKRVTRWFKQGVDYDDCNWTDNEIGELREKFLTITVTYQDGSVRALTCTPNHEILTPNGFVRAEGLDLDDEVIVKAHFDRLDFSSAKEVEPTVAVVTEVSKSFRTRYSGVRYNIEVEDNSNFIVCGVVVHNSPETRPGGEGQGFASSIEVKTWPGPVEIDDEAKTTLWVTQRFEVNKNKVSKAKISGEYKVVMSDQTGFKKEGDIMDEEEIVRLALRFNLMKRLNAKGDVDPNGRTVYAFSQKFGSESLVVKYMIENAAACVKLRSDLMTKMIEA